MFYFKNSALGADKYYSIDLSKMSGFSYANPADAANSDYIGTTEEIGIVYATSYRSKSRAIYATKPTNAIIKLGFGIGHGAWALHEIKFKYAFSGTIHLKIVEYTSGMGSGASGPSSTKLDATARASLNNETVAAIMFEKVPSHTLAFNGMDGYNSPSGRRYGIIITATSNTGEVVELSIPYMYCTYKSVISGAISYVDYRYIVGDPIIASGYNPPQVTNTTLTSEMCSSQDYGEINTDVLDLETKTFKPLQGPLY
jgi:hypothetical protein